MKYPLFNAEMNVEHFELETGKSHFRFNNVSWMSGRQLQPLKENL